MWWTEAKHVWYLLTFCFYVILMQPNWHQDGESGAMYRLPILRIKIGTFTSKFFIWKGEEEKKKEKNIYSILSTIHYNAG